MYTITHPETPRDKLPRRLKQALRAVQRGGGTMRQQALASALLRKGLRITTPYVGFNVTGEYLVVSERFRPGYPPIAQTLCTLMAELESYGYELLSQDTDDYGRVNSYLMHLPLMAKCVNGHHTPYRQVTRQQSCCPHCGEGLWTGPEQHNRVLLWQGRGYAATDETALPVPRVIEIFYDFNGTERPKPPLPPKGRRRRRYLRARKRWNDIQWGIYNAQVSEEIEWGHKEWLRQQYDAMLAGPRIRQLGK